MIKRTLKIADYILSGRTLVLLGPRRSGKTTLVKEYLANITDKKYVLYNGDRFSVREMLSPENFAEFEDTLSGLDILAIDEAQNIEGIGHTLKLINDEYPNISVIATGSSVFDLREQIGEPLVGRKVTLTLYPFSARELDFPNSGGQTLIFGSYPNVVTAKSNVEKEEFLYDLVDSLLLKDILSYKEIKSPEIIYQLLRLIAFQVGNEVSVNEICGKLGIHKETVIRYLDLLEKSFVIFKLGGYSANLRNEITKKPKYYFLDLGVRNAIIRDFSPLEERSDVGALWENYLILERMKQRKYNRNFANQYFWRNYDQQEIDLIEESNGKLSAYEFKWGNASRIKTPPAFKKNYPEATWTIVNRENAMGWLAD